MALQTTALEIGAREKDVKYVKKGNVSGAVVIINRLKLFSKSISNCTGLD